ncbi:hypothetical protein P615_05520 [Brevibacillus laterosporus PE36]|nr:hypothetical protein P615_05520 [Brevibacillus laterosporus PE36]
MARTFSYPKNETELRQLLHFSTMPNEEKNIESMEKA